MTPAETLSPSQVTLTALGLGAWASLPTHCIWSEDVSINWKLETPPPRSAIAMWPGASQACLEVAPSLGEGFVSPCFKSIPGHQITARTSQRLRISRVVGTVFQPVWASWRRGKARHRLHPLHPLRAHRQHPPWGLQCRRGACVSSRNCPNLSSAFGLRVSTPNPPRPRLPAPNHWLFLDPCAQ